jgi:hypothetical protein
MTISTKGIWMELFLKNGSIDWAEIFYEHISRWALLIIKFLSQNVELLEFYDSSNICENRQFCQFVIRLNFWVEEGRDLKCLV